MIYRCVDVANCFCKIAITPSVDILSKFRIEISLLFFPFFFLFFSFLKEYFNCCLIGRIVDNAQYRLENLPTFFKSLRTNIMKIKSSI